MPTASPTINPRLELEWDVEPGWSAAADGAIVVISVIMEVAPLAPVVVVSCVEVTGVVCLIVGDGEEEVDELSTTPARATSASLLKSESCVTYLNWDWQSASGALCRKPTTLAKEK